MASLNPVTGVLGNTRASHLLRRTVFGYNITTRQQFANLTASDAVDLLFQVPPAVTPPLEPLSSPLVTWIGGTPLSQGFELQQYLLHWWTAQLKNSGANIHERLVFHLHTHFPTIIERVPRTDSVYYQLALYRYYTTGSFKDLARAVVIDNAMLSNLDGKYNVSGAPQENFAREFFELFTVGKGAPAGPGNYTTFTEQDVQSATAVLTGWTTDETAYATLDPVTGLPCGKLRGNGTTAQQHTLGSKNFSASFQNTVITSADNSVTSAQNELTQFIDMVFNQDNAAQYIIRKLYRFFVYYNITTEVENDIIVPLAQQFKNSGYLLMPTLKTLLCSEHFFDEDDAVPQNDVYGSIIKSPLEVVLNALNTFDIPLPDEATDNATFHAALEAIHASFGRQGMDMYQPYDVAGYEAYYQFPMFNRCWITPNYLAERYKFFELLLGDSIPGINFNFVHWVKVNISNPADPDILLDELIELLFPVTPDAARRAFFRDDVFLDTLTLAGWQTEWNDYVNNGIDTSVRVPLERLFIAMTQSPEYQII
ncbi:MAG: DUF1800 family protein [Bacteroidia bacterium]|nr:DUF1800 family protein [Bacteroidia bacterium]